MGIIISKDIFVFFRKKFEPNREDIEGNIFTRCNQRIITVRGDVLSRNGDLMNENKIIVDEKSALLDKLSFSNVLIDDVKDIENLIEKDILQIYEGKKIRYLTKSGKEFSRLTVQDDVVRLSAGISGQTKKAYCTMDISISDDEKGNLCCLTVAEYKEHILRVKRHLEEEYGIIICTDCMYPKTLEVNKTFQIAEDFEAYKRVFQMIMGNLAPKSRLKGQQDYKTKEKNGYVYGTFYAKSSQNKQQYLEFKIYDKTASILGFVTLEENYVRFEFKIVGKIKRRLKIETFDELTDELINAWFHEKIEDYIVKPLKKMHKERQKKWLTIMEQERNKGGHWIGNVLGMVLNKEIEQGYPVFLDVEEIVQVVRLMHLDAKKRGKIVASLRRQAERTYTVLSKHDDEKMAEIIRKLTAKPTHHYTHQSGEEGHLRGMKDIA